MKAPSLLIRLFVLVFVVMASCVPGSESDSDLDPAPVHDQDSDPDQDPDDDPDQDPDPDDNSDKDPDPFENIENSVSMNGIEFEGLNSEVAYYGASALDGLWVHSLGVFSAASADQMFYTDFVVYTDTPELKAGTYSAPDYDDMSFAGEMGYKSGGETRISENIVSGTMTVSRSGDRFAVSFSGIEGLNDGGEVVIELSGEYTGVYALRDESEINAYTYKPACTGVSNFQMGLNTLSHFAVGEQRYSHPSGGTLSQFTMTSPVGVTVTLEIVYASSQPVPDSYYFAENMDSVGEFKGSVTFPVRSGGELVETVYAFFTSGELILEHDNFTDKYTIRLIGTTTDNLTVPFFDGSYEGRIERYGIKD